MENEQQWRPEPSFFQRNATSLKGAVIFVLMLILLIPAEWVSSIIYERKSREQEARNEIAQKWGAAQTILGPVLTVPVEFEKNGSKEFRNVHFLPETLKIKGSMQPERRKRGIFEVVVFQSGLQLEGIFKRPDIAPLLQAGEKPLWEKARLSLGVSDLKGLTEQVSLRWNEAELQFEPGIADNDLAESGVSLPIAWPENGAESIDFDVKLSIRGSENLLFVPVGKSTEAEIESPWPDPSFTGAFLPDQREVSSSGFKAHWKALHLNRNYPQAFSGKQSFDASAFGTSLVLPVNNYSKAERSVKYALLFISLTFLAVFFIEMRSNRRVHPLQYALIGLALIIFYALLVSISEQTDFNTAYAISAAMTIGLTTWFANALFQNRKMALLVGSTMVLLYGFLFTVLQLEDYALLIGSLGLFAILAAVMHFSRKIELEQAN